MNEGLHWVCHIGFSSNTTNRLCCSNSSLEFLIQNNINPLPCANITNPNLCNSTSYCFADSVTSICAARPVIKSNTNVTTTRAQPWCAGVFPNPFVATLFFLCMLLVGFCATGMIYLARYYDTYTKVVEGERMYNLFYLETFPIQMLLGVILFFCALLGFGAFIYFVDNNSCFYYYTVILFLLFGCGIPFLVLMIYLTYYLIVYLTKVELKLDLEDYITPTTEQALPNLANNVRCF